MQSWFRMSDDEARDRATGLLILAYGWGLPPIGAKLEQRIKRDLSKQFEWNSDDARVAYETCEAQRIAEQKIFISSKNATPRFRP
jgi:hypothetical protein